MPASSCCGTFLPEPTTGRCILVVVTVAGLLQYIPRKARAIDNAYRQRTNHPQKPTSHYLNERAFAPHGDQMGTRMGKNMI